MGLPGNCGGNFTDANGHFSSPSYPNYYPANTYCIYTISQPNGTVILLNFLSMDIQKYWYTDNCYDYLEIRDGPSTASPLLDKLCGSDIPAPIQSNQNQLWMRLVKHFDKITFLPIKTYFQILFRFWSDRDLNAPGFHVEYNTLELFTACGGNYSNASGVLSSPSYPNAYPEVAVCVYFISQPNGTYVNISFLTMDIDCEGLTTLTSDHIEVRDGSSEDSPLMGMFCGNGSNVPAFMQTTQNHLRIRREKKALRQKHNTRSFSSFSDSFPTTLQVDWDSSLNMNQQMCPNGAIAMVHVEAVSQPHWASLPHHPTQTTTLQIKTASTPSLSPLALSSCWTFSAWILRVIALATMII